MRLEHLLSGATENVLKVEEVSILVLRLEIMKNIDQVERPEIDEAEARVLARLTVL